MSHIKKSIQIILLILLFCLFAGCSTIDAVLPQHEFAAKMQANQDMNPNINSSPSPLVVYLYFLKQKPLFANASFTQLYSYGNRFLGDSLVSMKEVELIPGQTKHIIVPLKQSIKYVGIVAAYHNIGTANWKKIIKLDSSWGTEDYTLTFSKNAIIKN